MWLLHKFDYWVTPLLTLFLLGWVVDGWTLCVAGVFMWTFMEYWLHRVLHMKPFRRFHDQHHEHPKDDIEGQQWTVVPVVAFFILAVFAPTFMANIIAGLLIGYCLFLLVHYAMHEGWIARRTPGLGPLYQKHLVHHRPGREIWFGVTTTLWDRVFGTAAAEKD